MDYQGNYFPEERDENESKTYRTVKGIFKWTMYGISFVLYAVIFFLLFVNRDSKILEKNYMHELEDFKNVDTETIELYRIHCTTFMNKEGSLQVFNIDYAKDYGILELGVKFNPKNLVNDDQQEYFKNTVKKLEDYDGFIDYKLTDSEGKEYPIVKKVTDKHGRYGFARLCFSGLNIDLDANDLRYKKESNVNRTDITYYLTITRTVDNEELFKFKLYDNKITFSKTEYED